MWDSLFKTIKLTTITCYFVFYIIIIFIIKVLLYLFFTKFNTNVISIYYSILEIFIIFPECHFVKLHLLYF